MIPQVFFKCDICLIQLISFSTFSFIVGFIVCALLDDKKKKNNRGQGYNPPPENPNPPKKPTPRPPRKEF
jgi:hypothetical protein